MEPDVLLSIKHSSNLFASRDSAEFGFPAGHDVDRIATWLS